MARNTTRSTATYASDEIVEDLMQAGFTEYEAKVYLSLLASHPVSAYTISQNSGVPHSRVYDISRRLIRKGYAVSAGTNPEVFSPLAPEELVGKIRRDSEKLTKKLKRKLEEIDFVSDFDPVWNLHGREESLEKAREIIASAGEKIYIGFWSEEFKLLESELRKAHERGVQVVMLIYGRIDVDFGEVYYHERRYLDELDTQGRTIDCTADSRVCVSGILGNPGITKVVWTRNPGLVHSIENYLIHDFFLQEIYSRFGPKIDDLFGENLIHLRRKLNHELE